MKNRTDEFIETKIHEAFEEARDVQDTIYYDKYTTLYEEIIIRINKWLKGE